MCREPVEPEERWNPGGATPDLDGDEAEANVGVEGGSDDGTGQVRASAFHCAPSTTASPPVEWARQTFLAPCVGVTLLEPCSGHISFWGAGRLQISSGRHPAEAGLPDIFDMTAGLPARAISIWRVEPHTDHVTLRAALAVSCQAARSHKRAAAREGALPSPH